jgi:uncharacterized protein (DUF362 family)
MKDKFNVYVEKLDRSYLDRIREGLTHVGLESKLRQGDAVFIKPNLTFPVYKPGVMTSPECIENLVIVLKDYTDNITIGDGDGGGGYNKFSMYQVYENVGLFSMAKRYGLKLVNLSKVPSKDIKFNIKKKKLSIPIPKFLTEETDLFITVPIPKIHYLTRISISLKNQWGCISEPSIRQRLHPYFKEVIWELNNKIKVGISVVDGKFALNRNGPLRGDLVEPNWLMISDDILIADIVCCKIMGINPISVPYLKYIRNKVSLPSMGNVNFNKNYKKLIGEKFYLKREFWDYPGYFCFRSRILEYIGFRSPIAGLLHRLLYLFRKEFYNYAETRRIYNSFK